MALAWTSTLIEFRTLRAKFLALMVPFIVISTVIVFGLSEYTARRDAKQQLYAKLDALLEIQSAVLTEPLWNVADHQVELVLQAIAIDPDVLGAVVFDEKGEPVAAIGEADDLATQEFLGKTPIVSPSGREREIIGSLILALTDARLRVESDTRLLTNVGLGILLLLAVVAIALVANRRTVGIPLERLLISINRAREKVERVPVTWSSRDEMGEVVTAFNEMQTLQRSHEEELQYARDDLEVRVVERTNELAEKSRALEQLSNQLAKYLSPQVYDSIFKGKQEVKVASSRKKLTIFFSDIVGFTETADRLESEELTKLINHYLTEMSKIALEHGATIDKYVGDAILAFLGDPESRGVKEDALACVRMAIAMNKRLHALADLWRASGIEKPLMVRMGIHSGYCTVGNFGSEDRMDYTIIGGAVNTAARLEAAATPGEILVSYETFALVREDIHCVEKGGVTVKGIAYPVATYQVVDTYENLGAERHCFNEDHPHIKVNLDLDIMTSDERQEAADILRHALQILVGGEAPRPK
jgi:class 3 adenylate cyclase/uncharacterized membrane protein affecting hemolysin expression